MRLTSHTDYGLRLLMKCAEAHPVPVSIVDVAGAIQVSYHHLMKVAQGLTKAGYMKPVRGRTGGFCLAMHSRDIRVGDVVRSLESETGLVECMRKKGSNCPMIPSCQLPRLFQKASNDFFRVLDACTIDDLTAKKTPLTMIRNLKNED